MGKNITQGNETVQKKNKKAGSKPMDTTGGWCKDEN